MNKSAHRDPIVFIMSGIAIFLIVATPVAGVVFARSGDMRLLMATLLLTGIFALAGMAFGLVRGLRSGRVANRTRL